MTELSQISQEWGIDTEFVDAQGHRQTATASALERIAGALKARGAGPRDLEPPVTPHPAYQGRSEARQWLLAVQLYAVRSARNWGHGDFTDLAMLVELAAKFGAAGVGLNPLHALFPDRAEQASPYAPNSRLFLTPSISTWRR